MSEYYSESKSSGGRLEVELDLYYYATKADTRNSKGIDT